LTGYGRGVECLDRLALDLGEHLRLEPLVELARLRLQVDDDVVVRQRRQVEVILGAYGERDVRQLLGDLDIGTLARQHLARVEVLVEVTLLELAESSAEPLAAIEEPALPPEVDQPVG